jgi:carbonic anhydrase/acetyltransferase-like protein (isoleucine patch superfamily)
MQVMIYELGEHRLSTAGDDFWIADNATVLGRVHLGRRVSIWFNVVIRADGDDVVIGDDTNIQDGSVLHIDPGKPLRIGRGCTIGHKVMLHGCEIGDYSLIGINAVVLNGARIGKHCLIGANALIPEGMEIPDGSLVMGSPGRIKRTLSDAERENLQHAAQHYVDNAARFRRELRPDPRFTNGWDGNDR